MARRDDEGHIPKTQPIAFSADEGADVGVDGKTNVSTDCTATLDRRLTVTIRHLIAFSPKRATP